jgi:cation transport regulator ChaC
MGSFDDHLVVFGYGSLLWRHDELEAAHSSPARVRGYVRRLHQSSPDHRGTASAPGRVATLSLAGGAAAEVHGTVFFIPAHAASRVLCALADRERAGYERVDVDAELLADGRVVRASTFTAAAGNAHFAGHCDGGGEDAATGLCASPRCACASAVAAAAGASGANADYFARLLAAMRGRGVRDAYLEALLPRVQAARRGAGLPPLPLCAHALALDVLAHEYAVCRLPAGAAIPAAVFSAGPPDALCSVTRTDAEVSVVCEAGAAAAVAAAAAAARVQGGWRALRVRGPLPFDAVGILAALAGALAAAGVSLFSLSTFDTDVVLVGAPRLADAVAALRAAGHAVAD